MPSRTSLNVPRKSLPYSDTVTRCYSDKLFLCICLKPVTRYPLTLVQPSRNRRRVLQRLRVVASGCSTIRQLMQALSDTAEESGRIAVNGLLIIDERLKLMTAVIHWAGSPCRGGEEHACPYPTHRPSRSC